MLANLFLFSRNSFADFIIPPGDMLLQYVRNKSNKNRKSLSSPVILAGNYEEELITMQQDAFKESAPLLFLRGLRKYELSWARERDLICVLAGDTIWDLINAKLCKRRQ